MLVLHLTLCILRLTAGRTLLLPLTGRGALLLLPRLAAAAHSILPSRKPLRMFLQLRWGAQSERPNSSLA